MAEDQTPPEGDEELRAQLSTADQNDLPDDAFAYIEPGGTKDSDGKTVPRDKRHFPIHDKAHVANALAQAPKSPFGDKAMPAIKAAAKKFGIGQQNAALVAAERRRKERHRAVPLLEEVRHWKATGLEVRSNAKTDEIEISGAPIVYGADYTVMDMFGEFTERMMPGVARDVLSSKPDVRFLFNHDGLPLARSISGTLALQDTDESLRFTATLDARQQLANDLAIAIERGDVSQMSCGFVVARDEWDDAMEDRSIHALADLLDVSAVTYPASPTTSIKVAQRMAMEMPVESRARLRRVYADLRAGRTLSPERVEAFRALLDTDIDPGDDTLTPDGTGPLGSPEGDGKTWADPGSAADVGDSTPADGTEGQGTTDGAAVGIQDGTGSRSDSQTSRLTRLRVKRATRGL